MYYFSDTPYRRFSEIREAALKGDIRLSYNRATAIRVASGRRKSFALMYLYIPAITAVVLYVLTEDFQHFRFTDIVPHRQHVAVGIAMASDAHVEIIAGKSRLLSTRADICTHVGLVGRLVL